MKKKISYILQTIFPSFITNLFLSIKYQSFIHPKAKIYWPKNMKIGKGCRIGRGTTITAQGGRNSIVLGDNVIIEDYCTINNKGGTIVIGKNSALNHYAMIQSTKNVEIGDNVAIAPYVRIVPNHTYKNGVRTGTEKASTIIGNNCWICAGVTIIIGNDIGENSIIAANAVVNKSIPANKIAGGIPVKLIKDFDL